MYHSTSGISSLRIGNYMYHRFISGIYHLLRLMDKRIIDG